MKSFKLQRPRGKEKIIKKKKEDNWQPCPRCKSGKVQKRGKGFYFLLGFLMMCFSIWLLIIPPVGIAGIAIGFIIMAISPFMKEKLYCKDCKFSWKFSYDEVNNEKGKQKKK